MTEPDRGTDRAGRRAKRFLTPLQKYEIFLSAGPPGGDMARGGRALAGRPRGHHADPDRGQGGRAEALSIRPGAKQRPGTTSWSRPGPMRSAWARRSRRWP